VPKAAIAARTGEELQVISMTETVDPGTSPVSAEYGVELSVNEIVLPESGPGAPTNP
jgi:hypothetical protein